MTTALAVSLGLGGDSGAAQVIRGRIVDAESAEPVVLAYVGLLAPGRELVVAQLADTDGRFSVRAPREGSYFIYVTRTGYQAVMDGLFEIGEDGVFDVRIGMKPSPIVLDPLRVGVDARRSRPGDLRTVGFYDRRDSGLGHFIEREEIDRVAIEDLTDAMRGIPQLIVETPATNVLVPSGVMSPEILVRMGTDLCSPMLYVDGHVVTRGNRRRFGDTAVRPGDYVDPRAVEAVEVYTSPSEIPAEFQANTGCGVVLIWTRRR